MGQGNGPGRPSSPQLALGRSQRPETPSSDDDGQEGGRQLKGASREAADAQRCDDLERLLVRKIVAKQPLHGSSTHTLANCHACTIPVPPFHHTRLEDNPGTHAHEKGAHRHTQRPHRMPSNGRLVRTTAKLEPNKCAKLQRSTAWRQLDDMPAAGRLPVTNTSTTRGGGGGSGRLQPSAMNLPSQRSAGSRELRQSVKRWFSSRDLSGDGEEFTLKQLGLIFEVELGLPTTTRSPSTLNPSEWTILSTKNKGTNRLSFFVLFFAPICPR